MPHYESAKEAAYAETLRYRDELMVKLLELQETIRGLDAFLSHLSSAPPPGRPPVPTQEPPRPDPSPTIHLQPRRYTKAEPPPPQQPTPQPPSASGPTLSKYNFDTTNHLRDILGVIAKGVSGYAPTSDQISRKLGMPIEAVRGRLGLLSRDGSVLNQNSGYHITESGREFLGNPSLSGTSPASRNNKRNSKKFFRTHQRRPDLDSNIMYVLKESGSAGMGSADVSEYLDIPTGTASHHMSTLARKGLIGHISPLYYHLDFMPQIKATE